MKEELTEDARKARLEAWGRERLGKSGGEPPTAAKLVPVSDDASFRRYFRFTEGAPGRVLVDAPPAHEDNKSYVLIASALRDNGLACPEVLAVDYASGFLVVSDLGDDRYLDVINNDPGQAEGLYRQAIAAMARMQATQCELPAYDNKRLREEMDLFDRWFLPQLLRIEPDDGVSRMLAEVKSLLVANALAQPQVFTHRDYHSRNLMALGAGGPGILDFQDAVIGPVTYDPVSLLKDCYHRLERQAVTDAVSEYRGMLASQGALHDVDDGTFLKWFDLMGVQRHLKCAGIFSRLWLRDNKPGYLGDIPLVVDYLAEACGIYPELAALGEFLAGSVTPAVKRFQR